MTASSARSRSFTTATAPDLGERAMPTPNHAASALRPRDRRRQRRGIMLACALACGLVCTNARASEAAPVAHGLELVPWSKKVGEDRYESPRDFEGTLKFFRDKLKGWRQIRWSRETSLPHVKYQHIENTNTQARWHGVNIYALPDGRVRYYVIPRARKAPDGADKAKPARAPRPAGTARPASPASPASPSSPR